MRILLAEDDPVNRRKILKALEEELEREGYPVHTAKNGMEAWELYQELRPELIITDWMMPGLNGIELCQRIRAANARETVQPYILMLTARAEAEDLRTGFHVGRANEFISKPFDPIELIARFRVGAENQRLARQLERERRINEEQALTDHLTGLGNRHQLMRLLRADEGRALRSRVPMSVVIADVDRFKTINDEYGHATGDRVLERVAESLQACVRSGDHVGRWGGEEFLLILPDTDLIHAAEVAERCRATLTRQQIESEDGRLLRVSSSFGVASADGVDRPDVMELVHQADKALYWAKEAGRNRVKIYVASADPERRRA